MENFIFCAVIVVVFPFLTLKEQILAGKVTVGKCYVRKKSVMLLID